MEKEVREGGREGGRGEERGVEKEVREGGWKGKEVGWEKRGKWTRVDGGASCQLLLEL